jgi:photosystem II stability/assembly factor-like uncharacterized protein
MKKVWVLLTLISSQSAMLFAQDSLSADVLNAFQFRSIGPTTTGGRIIDLAVNPQLNSEYYVAAAYGGVWKTTNNGATFNPIFDNYGTQSIGCITMDPKNTNVLWVGTGENNNQRSVGYGNGIYKSLDGGKSFSNMGLKNSEHIGMIKVHPTNSQIVFVAAYGPLWKEGGERGLYKTEDGGKTWNRIHHVSENTGCNEVHLDPSNPDIVYAAFHQRRRHEWTYLGGGPESALFKSNDGGKTWKKLTGGLPGGDVGRITLCIPSQNSNRVYAMVEAQAGKSGVYVSNDKGESWSKTNDFSTAGNYYQEMMVDPANPDRFFIMDTWLKWSKDGGKTITSVGEKWKHVDNHAIWIQPDNTAHWLVGCDGGLYETWDDGKNWIHKDNLNITQFYRVTVDNATPFYNVYGGTQDNNTLGGPSANASGNGIPNSDWFITVGGDGFKTQVDPTDPNIVYSQWQYGGLIRYDRRTGEQIDIKPITGLGENGLRWNWDAPLIISAHNPQRLYFAANRIYRSNDRGNSWEAISPDLSRGIDRNKLPVMGRVWSIDAVAKNQSTSIYGNIMWLAESPKDEQLLFAGTDDGLIQISTDGGKTWNKQSKFTGVPEYALVSCIVPSQHDRNTVYATFDNHRKGDFKPYILKSTDAGKTWTSIANNLPQNGSVKTFAEDHVSANLLFAGSEFGFYASNNAGKKWTPWTAGLAPVAIKDIAIQKRENDIALATFGRGFVILDDYSALREATPENLNKDAYIFGVKPAKMFNPRTPLGGNDKGSKGASYFNAPNPATGALIRFHLKNEYKTIKETRQANEAKLQKENKPAFYPSVDSLRMEAREEQPFLLVVIADEKGKEIHRIKTSASKGMGSVNWDLRYSGTSPLTRENSSISDPYTEPDFGPFVAPGNYQATLFLVKDAQFIALGNKQIISVDYLVKPTLLSFPAEDRQKLIDEIAETRRNVSAAADYFNELSKGILTVKNALFVGGVYNALMTEISGLQLAAEKLNTQFNGDGLLASKEFETAPGINDRIDAAVSGMVYSSNGPTITHVDAFKAGKSAFVAWLADLKQLDTQFKQLQAKLDAAKVPYTPGRTFFFEVK